MKSYLWLTVVVLAAAGCARDPLRFHSGGDGGAADGAVDQTPALDRYIPDARRDVVRPDLSHDACIAQVELCNNKDDNCNNTVDEGYDKLNDARFCEGCKGCQHLLGKNAIPGCKAGTCAIKSCKGGWVDADKQAATGCEYECTPTGVEICDGIDNDCDGKVDNLQTSCTSNAQCEASISSDSKCLNNVCTPPDICKKLGACKPTACTADADCGAGGRCVDSQCALARCHGSRGWICEYGPDVELQLCKQPGDCGGGFQCVNGVCPGVVIIDEQKCDGKDGDCDSAADDPWMNPGLPNPLNSDCDPIKKCNSPGDCDQAGGSTCKNGECTPKQGACRDVGVVACTPNGQASYCQFVKAGQAPAPELCNGIDDNCNGLIDDGVTDEQWVDIGSVEVFKYEASRPDADAAGVGILSNGRPCSVPGRLPWANITRGDAQAACQRAGGRLCTVAEWQTACKGAANTTYPYGNAFDGTQCNGRAYSASWDEPLPTHQPATCVSGWNAAGDILNMSGNVKEWTATSFTGGTPDGFELRGGAYDTPSLAAAGAGLSCTYELPAPTDPTLQLPTIGFRCCKGP